MIAALIGFLAFVATIAICCFYSRYVSTHGNKSLDMEIPLKIKINVIMLHYRYKSLMRKHAPVKIIEAPVRAYIPTSLPPGSIHGGPSIAGKIYLLE